MDNSGKPKLNPQDNPPEKGQQPEQVTRQQQEVSARQEATAKEGKLKQDAQQQKEDKVAQVKEQRAKENFPPGSSTDEQSRLHVLRNKKNRTAEEQEELNNLEEPTV